MSKGALMRIIYRRWASTLWRRRSQCDGRRSHSPSGTWAGSASSSTCFHSSAMTPWRSYSCSTSLASRRSTRSKSGTVKRGGSTRQRYHFSSEPSLIPLRHSHATNRRRSQSRQSALPRRCMHHSSFARHLRRSTCKRSSKSCSQRRSTSNASFQRLRGSASLYCSTWTCECPVRTLFPPARGLYDARPRRACPYSGAGLYRAWVYMDPSGLSYLSFIWPTSHPLYISQPPFVAPALLSSSRSIVATAAYHAPPHPSVAFIHSTRCNLRLYPNNPYFRPYICPAFLVRVTYWGVHVDATHAR